MWSSFVTSAPGALVSYSPRVGPPDVLVQLRLQPRRDVVGEHPFGERLHLHLSPDRREEHRPAAEVALFDDAAGPIVVVAIGDHELDLVVRAEDVEVLPAVLFYLARAGALEVEDDLRARVDGADVDRPRGLDQHFVAVVAETLDQLERLRLRERLAPPHLDQVAAVAAHAAEHLVDRHPLAAGERGLGVAPAAAGGGA